MSFFKRILGQGNSYDSDLQIIQNPNEMIGYYVSNGMFAPITRSEASSIMNLRSGYSYQSRYAMQRSGYTHDSNRLAQLYISSVTAWSAISAKMDMLSQLPVVIDSDNENLPEKNPAQWFIDNSEQLLAKASACLDIWGVCYFKKVYRSSNLGRFPNSLRWINNLDITPMYNGYIIDKYMILEDNNQYTIDASEIVAIKIFNPFLDEEGLSPLGIVADSVGAESNMQVWSNSFFMNSTRIDGIMIYEGGKIGQENLSFMKKQLKEFKGPRNAWKTLILDGGHGWKWIPITPPPNDLAMPEFDTQITSKICNVFKINPVLIGSGKVGDHMGATNTYHQTWSKHIENVELPRLRSILCALNSEWLSEFPDYVFNARLKPDIEAIYAITRLDSSRAELASLNLNSGVWDLNRASEFQGGSDIDSIVKRNPQWAINAFQSGLLTLNQARLDIGALPIKDNRGDMLIWDIDQRLQPQPISGPVSFPDSLRIDNVGKDDPDRIRNIVSDEIEKALARFIEIKKEDQVYQEQDEIIDIEPEDGETSLRDKQLGDLKLLRSKARRWLKENRGKKKSEREALEFISEFLPEKVLKSALREINDFWNIEEVIRQAKEVIEIGDEREITVGATPEEFLEYWQDADVIGAQTGEAWLEYMANVSGEWIASAIEHFNEGKSPASFNIPETETQDISFFDALIGDIDNPGALTKIALAGAAGGNQMVNRQVANLRDEIDISIGWDVTSQEVIDFVNERAKFLIPALNETTLNDFRMLFIKSIEEGWSLEEFTQAIQEFFEPLIPGGIDRKRAESIAQTETTVNFNEGTFIRWESIGVMESDWITVRDSRVCPICRGLHGVRSTREKGWKSRYDGKTYYSSAHTKCRCPRRPVVNPNILTQPLIEGEI